MPSNHPLSILIRANGVRKLARGIIGRWRTLPPPFCAPGEMDIDGRILNSSENHGSRVYRNRAPKRSMQSSLFPPLLPCWSRIEKWEKKKTCQAGKRAGVPCPRFQQMVSPERTSRSVGPPGGLHEYRKLCRANEVTSSTRSAKHKYLGGTVTALLETWSTIRNGPILP